MTEFKKGDRVRLKGNHPYDTKLKEGVIVWLDDNNVSYPLDVLVGREYLRFSLSEVEFLAPARLTVKEEILNLKAQIIAIRAAGLEMGVAPDGIARAKGIIEGLNAALAFIHEESLSEEDRDALESIDGGLEPW